MTEGPPSDRLLSVKSFAPHDLKMTGAQPPGEGCAPHCPGMGHMPEQTCPDVGRARVRQTSFDVPAAEEPALDSPAFVDVSASMIRCALED